MSRTLKEAYQAHIDVRHITDQEPLDYVEFLEGYIDDIRGMAEPLAYAIRENPPRDINDQTIVSVYRMRHGSDWLEGAPEIPMQIGYFRKLLHMIYDDYPELTVHDKNTPA